jgi:DNA-binding Xre family transcriptional regulator
MSWRGILVRFVGRGNPGCQTSKISTLFLCLKTNIMDTLEAPHIGHIIKKELARQGRTVTWLAAQLNCSRQNVYGIFENKWIYTDTLWKICEILDFDFFEVYSIRRQKIKPTSKT